MNITITPPFRTHTDNQVSWVHWWTPFSTDSQLMGNILTRWETGVFPVELFVASQTLLKPSHELWVGVELRFDWGTTSCSCLQLKLKAIWFTLVGIVWWLISRISPFQPSFPSWAQRSCASVLAFPRNGRIEHSRGWLDWKSKRIKEEHR